MVDTKLLMDEAIDKILSQVRPKVHAILRTRRHYEVRDLIDQFKTHVWSLMEIHTGAIFHASDYLLAKIDNVQRSFLRELGVEEEQGGGEQRHSASKVWFGDIEKDITRGFK